MTIEQVQQVLPLMQAFAEGKTIQTKNGSRWIDIDSDKDQLILDSVVAYQDCFRIKPEHKYRPFKDAEECWNEMQKHQPFGWVKYKDENKYTTYCNIDGNCDFEADFDDFTFVDGTPFGIKEGADD